MFEEGAYADRAFRAEADAAGLEGRDRALAQRLAYGTIQRRLTLDHVLAELASRPLERIDARLRVALELGLFQILFMGAVPDHAAVGETVELAKAGGAGPGKFANAVLRRATREGRALLDALNDDTPAAAAVLHSHPEWIAELWWAALGPDDARALLRRDNEPAESAVRANTLATSREDLASELAAAGVACHPSDPPEALLLDEPWDVHASEAFGRGALMPQSRASMLVARVVDPQPGERVLDLCAAPGAKSTHLAALMGDEGEISAVEIHAGRAEALETNCRRMRAHSVRVVRADALDPPWGPFDRVLLDAPCSGLGTLQARPDSRWRRSPERVTELAQLQAQMLEQAAMRVRAGGTLVYSTCTVSPEENERVVEGLLASRDDFAVDDLGVERPAERHPHDPRMLLVLPHRLGSDGFFVARLRRAG